MSQYSKITWGDDAMWDATCHTCYNDTKHLLRRKLTAYEGKQSACIAGILDVMYHDMVDKVGSRFSHRNLTIEVDSDTYAVLYRRAAGCVKHSYCSYGVSYVDPYSYEVTIYGVEIHQSDNVGEHEILMTYAEEKTMEPKFTLSFADLNLKLTNEYPTIKKVIFNKPATIVYWSDKTKTVVKCGKHDKWDKEKGLAMAISKKLVGLKEFYKQYDNASEEKENKK